MSVIIVIDKNKKENLKRIVDFFLKAKVVFDNNFIYLKNCFFNFQKRK
jgi:hypothetical protein